MRRSLKILVTTALLLHAPVGFSKEAPDLTKQWQRYSSVLWFDAIQKEGFDQQVKTIIEAAVEKLYAADNAQNQNIFSILFPKPYDVYRDKRIVISKTPWPHIENEQFAIPFYAFLEPDPSHVISFLVAALHGQKEQSFQEAMQWAADYLKLPPGQAFQTLEDRAYLNKLGAYRPFRWEELIGIEDIQGKTLRFRVLSHHQNLMVPVDEETPLIDLIEGVPRDYPIVTIQLERILDRLELHLIQHLINTVRQKDLNTEEVAEIIKTGISISAAFPSWYILDKYIQKIPYRFIRWPAYLINLFGNYIVFDYAVDSTSYHLGMDDYLHGDNLRNRSIYETTLITFRDSRNDAILDRMNLRLFKRQLCFDLGLNYETAENIYLKKAEEEVLDYVESNHHQATLKRKIEAQKNLALVIGWLQRLKEAKAFTDTKDGYTYFEVPPRNPSKWEEGSNVALGGSIGLMQMELVHNKMMGLKTALRSAKLLGGSAVAALAIDYLLGVSSTETIILPLDEKQEMEEQLTLLRNQLEKTIRVYDLVLKRQD